MGALAVPALLGLSGVPALAQNAPNKLSPATNEDLFVYGSMGTSFFCMAALNGVEFPKALGISVSTYAQALKGRHNGQVASLKGKTLTEKEIMTGAEQQVILRAMQLCPKAIPADVQAKVKAALKKQGATK